MAALGRPGYVTVGHGGDFAERTPDAMRAQAHAVLDAAYAGGLRYFDAARSYGRAEEFLGEWLAARGLTPRDLTVASKWGYVYEANWRIDAPVHERKEHSAALLERQVEESAALLGKFLRLYQIHSATIESRVLENEPVLDALARLRDRSLAIGLTTSGPRQAETLRLARSIVRDGRPLFDAVQATWNLHERSCEEALREAKQAGMTVIVKEALANGRLTSRGDLDENSELARLASDKGVTPDAIAIAAALAQPFADVVLLGASTVEQLHANLAALRIDLSGEELARLASLRETPESYWETRSRLPWS